LSQHSRKRNPKRVGILVGGALLLFSGPALSGPVSNGPVSSGIGDSMRTATDRPVTARQNHLNTSRSASGSETFGQARLDLSWLSGCWQDELGSKEVWSAVEGRFLFGYGITRREGQVVFFEQLRIEQQGDDARYVAMPAGTSQTIFDLHGHEPEKVVFATPNHDYPQLITYEQQGDRLIATISMMDGTRSKRFDKTRCVDS